VKKFSTVQKVTSLHPTVNALPSSALCRSAGVPVADPLRAATLLQQFCFARESAAKKI
jgi:hypothetical protein